MTGVWRGKWFPTQQDEEGLNHVPLEDKQELDNSENSQWFTRIHTLGCKGNCNYKLRPCMQLPKLAKRLFAMEGNSTNEKISPGARCILLYLKRAG